METFPFGGEAIRNDTATISTASVSISPAKSRIEFIFTNSGATNITLSLGKEAVAGSGIFLPPYSSYFGTLSENFRPTSEEIFAISSGAGGTLSIFER